MVKKIYFPFISALILLSILFGCNPDQKLSNQPQKPTLQIQSGSTKSTQMATPNIVELTPSRSVLPTNNKGDPTATPASLTPTQTISTTETEDWKEMPVIPDVSEETKEIFKRGQQLGNKYGSFSKVGDCESRTTWFLSDFDSGPKFYNLGPYHDLQATIDHYSGSFGRLSQAARPGFSVASLISPFWSDPQVCQKNETPLACEFRINRPAFVLISIGTNDVAHPESFEKNLRKVIDFSIQQGVVPILSTKADNLEGDNHLNATIGKLAQEYKIPLWNFWRSVQSLPQKGLQPDQAHLTWSPNNFSDPENLKRAWPVRNLTALQVLDELWKKTQFP